MSSDPLLQQQLAIEHDALSLSRTKAEGILRASLKNGNIDQLPEGQLLLKTSVDLVAVKIEELFTKTMKVRKYIPEYEGKYDELAYVVVISLLRTLAQHETVRTTKALQVVAKAIGKSLGELRLKTKEDNLQQYVKERYKKWSAKDRKAEELRIIKHAGLLREGDLEGRKVASFAGYFIEAVIASGANLIEIKNVYNRSRHRTESFMYYTEDAMRIVMQSRDYFIHSLLVAPPLIIEPKPWDSYMGTGGYYTPRKEGFSYTAIKANYKAVVDSKELIGRYLDQNKSSRDNTFSVLNTLSKTAWCVNKDVLSVMDFVFTENIADPEAPQLAPRLVGGLPVNEVIKVEDYARPEDVGGKKQSDGSYVFPEGSRDWRSYFILRDKIRDHASVNQARALMTALSIATAKKFKDYNELYFSYQADSRGRLYPLQTHLNPIGSDSVKALLQFARGEALATPAAVKWFMIHGANTYGFDKLSYDERVTKIEAMHDAIMQIADDPLGHRDVWSNCDSPYMFLAWCFEYADYKRNPDHEVKIAVALDATCSGIQMYAGLLKDAEGAKAVNVIGEDRSDIYQQVADTVNRMLTEGDHPDTITYNQSDGSKHDVWAKPIAHSLAGKITRSLVKQPTMTKPYSVTRRGMETQIRTQLDELETQNNKFWLGDNWVAAKLLAELVDRSIDEVVIGATVGQSYLKQFAEDIGQRQPYIFYTSPLTNFPVLLSTRKTKTRRITTAVGKFTLRVNTGKLDIRSLKSGIAPNFIHSLDSALLATIVTRMAGEGVKDFHVIHDSYGIHPNNVELFNKVSREAFVDLFEANPLQSLINQTYPDYEIQPESVLLNTLNLQDVYDSQYLFS